MVAIAGLTAIGRIATVNFLIIWDCKWLIVAFPLPWPLALKQSTRGRRYFPFQDRLIGEAGGVSFNGERRSIVGHG